MRYTKGAKVMEFLRCEDLAERVVARNYEMVDLRMKESEGQREGSSYGVLRI